MLSKSRITLAAVLATAALSSSPSLALAADPEDIRGEHAAALADSPAVSIGPAGVQGEYAASLSDGTAVSESPKGDLRGEAAVEPFARPVVVEVANPVSTGFDWSAAIIGLAGGLAIAILAGVGVTRLRRRHAQPRTV
jgi:hypothetical protein